MRLYVLEISALIFGILALIGIINIILRRVRNAKSRIVTSVTDWILYGLILVQIATGLHIAVSNTWGSSWFATIISPYLWTLVKFAPDPSYIAPLPFTVKLHIVGLWALLAFFPFTRLVHVLVIPNPYLWRRPQVVRWYSRRGASRRAS